jgi:hypothetical protein
VSENWMQRSLRAVGKTKGDCLATEVLAKFLGAELSAEDSAAVVRHVASCGVCDALLERMRQFDNSDAWQGVDRRLAQRFETFLSGQRLSVFSVLLRPWFAYVIVLLLIYPAYLGLVRRPTMRTDAPLLPARPLESAKILQLDAARGAAGREINLTGRDKVLILSFFVPVRTSRQYSAEITDRKGVVIAAHPEITSYDSNGNFYLVCDRHLFTGGQYTLTVKESGGTKREFQFPFAL